MARLQDTVHEASVAEVVQPAQARQWVLAVFCPATETLRLLSFLCTCVDSGIVAGMRILCKYAQRSSASLVDVEHWPRYNGV